jgi:formylglycine-generating enzyme
MENCPVCHTADFGEQCLQCGWYVNKHWSEEERKLRLQERIDIWYEDEIAYPNGDMEFDQELMGVPPTISYPMRKIEACRFQMGSHPEEEGRDSDEQQHMVSISNPFWIGLTEIPQNLWMEVLLHNPSIFLGVRRPADSVNWFEAIQFCNRYSQKMGFEPVYTYEGRQVLWNQQANGFRLPTEAEWELASRMSRAEHFEDPNYAWFQENSNWSTRTISIPNKDEFLDFAGNVWEWCWDIYDVFSEEEQFDPIGSKNGEHRVLKGGSYVDDSRVLRPSNRAYSEPTQSSDSIGFRIARNVCLHP